MTQARQVVARTCLLQTCCTAATMAAGGGNEVWHGAGKLASLPPPLPFLSFPLVPIAFSSVLCCAPAVVTSPCAIAFHSNCLFTRTHMHNTSRVPARFIAGFPCCIFCSSSCVSPLCCNSHSRSPPPFPLSSACICSLFGCDIGVDGARAIGAAVPMDRNFGLELSRCVMRLAAVQQGFVWCDEEG